MGNTTEITIKLERIREEKGIGPKEMAKRLGMARSAFYKKKDPESGDRFNEMQLELFAKELGYELGLIYK